MLRVYMGAGVLAACGASASVLSRRQKSACTYLLQELAELSAFGISGAQILFGCHHRADAAPVCILSRAVHLPPLLWPDGLHAEAQARSWTHSPHRQTCFINSTPMISLWWNCGTQLLRFLIFILAGHPFFCLVPPKLWHQPIPLTYKKVWALKVLLL